MFRKKVIPEVSNDSYARWLRAQRPNMGEGGWWFFTQPALIQEALATEGDRYVADCVEMGAELGEANLPDEVEEAARIGAEMLDRAAQGKPKRTAPPLTFGGVTERREMAAADRKLAADKARSFLGRKPDGVEGATG